MTSVAKRYGPAQLAFIILPLVSAFYVDLANGFIIIFLWADDVLSRLLRRLYILKFTHTENQQHAYTLHQSSVLAALEPCYEIITNSCNLYIRCVFLLRQLDG